MLEQDGRHDFDFIIGRWRIHNRRLIERLKGSDEWEEFAATGHAQMILGGLGNFDEGSFDLPAGRLIGATLRLYDPQAQQWSIYWADNRTPGKVGIPLVGAFKDGRGEFYAQEVFEGRSIFSRFIWSEITPTSCHWEQAFSSDGGATWETNWTMDFTRSGDE